MDNRIPFRPGNPDATLVNEVFTGWKCRDCDESFPASTPKTFCPTCRTLQPDTKSGITARMATPYKVLCEAPTEPASYVAHLALIRLLDDPDGEELVERGRRRARQSAGLSDQAQTPGGTDHENNEGAATNTAGDLEHREYLTPSQAAKVFGRSREVYSGLLDSGCVEGYRTKGGHRYLKTKSIRDYLAIKSRRPSLRELLQQEFGESIPG